MAEVKQFSRIQNHRLTTTGEVPTIPVVDDVTDSSFLATDLKNGEICINTTDDKVFIRSGSSILEISTTSVPGTSPWVFDGNDIKTNAVIGSPAVYPKVLPQVSNEIDLGSSSLRFKGLYLLTGTITTLASSIRTDVMSILGNTHINEFTLDFNYAQLFIDDNTDYKSGLYLGKDESGSLSSYYYRTTLLSSDYTNSAMSFIATGYSNPQDIKFYSTDGSSSTDLTITEKVITLNANTSIPFAINGNAKMSISSSGINIPQNSTIEINSTGTAPIVGKATLSSGTATVNTTNITTSSIVILTPQTGGSTGDVYVSARTAGTSFTITSSNGADARDIGWLIVEKV